MREALESKIEDLQKQAILVWYAFLPRGATVKWDMGVRLEKLKYIWIFRSRM